MEVLYDTREKPRQEDTTYIENIAIAFRTKSIWVENIVISSHALKWNLKTKKSITVFLRKTNVQHM